MYLLKPQYCGATFHKISQKIDGGDILHQCTPKLKLNQGIHDVGVETVFKATKDLLKILKSMKSLDQLKYIPQKSDGKIFFSNEFKPEHLLVIYETYKNNIVNYYLKSSLKKSKPKLVNYFKNI